MLARPGIRLAAHRAAAEWPAVRPGAAQRAL